jgi:hypothetical protein
MNSTALSMSTQNNIPNPVNLLYQLREPACHNITALTINSDPAQSFVPEETDIRGQTQVLTTPTQSHAMLGPAEFMYVLQLYPFPPGHNQYSPIAMDQCLLVPR